MALIESVIKRRNGTRVTFDGGAVVYHFKPDSTGAHVADVSNAEHAERLLSIKPQAYVAVNAVKPKPAAPAKQPEPVEQPEAVEPDEVPTEVEPEPEPEPAPAPKPRTTRARAKPKT